jgi:hypothetical protein
VTSVTLCEVQSSNMSAVIIGGSELTCWEAIILHLLYRYGQTERVVTQRGTNPRRQGCPNTGSTKLHEAVSSIFSSIFIRIICTKRSRDSAVGIATGYGLGGRGIGVRVPGRVRFLSSPRRPDRFWGLPSLLSNGHRGLLPRSKAAGA